MKKCKINEYLDVISENGKWDIYIDNKIVPEYEYNIIDIDPSDIINSDGKIVSADDIFLDVEFKKPDFDGVCQILNFWYDHSYSTCLLNKEAAFPLLKILFIEGESLALDAFGKEIRQRLRMGEPNVIRYLIKWGYNDYLDEKTMAELENLKFQGGYLKAALYAKKFISRFTDVLNSEEVWNGYFDLNIEYEEIEKIFAVKMEVETDEDEGMSFRTLSKFNSYTLIEKLNNIPKESLVSMLRAILSNIKKKPRINEHITKEFSINDNLTLKFVEETTIVYVNNKRFIQCKYLLLNIDTQEFDKLEEIDSIDVAAEQLDNSLEYGISSSVDITPEEEFWGHCSNLQAWTENDYDTSLLHSNISFPLLYKLAEEGDIKARKIFKEEMVKRFLKEYPPVVAMLV